MASHFQVDWQRLFVPTEPLLETMLRGSFTFLAIFVLLRVFRRQTGSLGPADLLVLLLIADAAQNAMADDYKSITDGLVLIATIIGWEYLLDWLSFRSRRVRDVLERSPLLLIRDGVVLTENLTSELMTHDALLAQLRQKGIASPAQVERCFLEGDGHVSVIPFSTSSPVAPETPFPG